MKIIKKFFVLILLVCLTGFWLRPLPAAGITLTEEEELSHKFLKIALSRFDLIRDPLIVGYVNQVGQKLIATLPEQPFEYHFYVIEEPVYNAFATPAGHIFVHSGLLMAMETEDELAGILAHELAHGVCRHISQKIERASRINLATLAGLAAGIFLGIGGAGAEAVNAVTVGTMAAGQSASLAYSRQDERQADQLGLSYLTKAGYSAKGLLRVLKKIKDKQWFGSETVPDYMMTHPAVEERIRRISAWLADHPVPEETEGRFDVVHTRLKAGYGDREEALAEFRARLKADPDDPLAHHGYGLALERSAQRKEAIAHYKQALKEKPFDPHLLKDWGRALYFEGEYEKARKALNSAFGISPADPELLLYLGRTHLALADYSQARSHLEKLVNTHPRYSLHAYYFLGEACNRGGDQGNSHFYLGLYHRKKGELKTAQHHLKKALPLISDPLRKEAIETQLKEIAKARDRIRAEAARGND